MSVTAHLGLYPFRFKEVLRNYSFGDRWIVREFAKADLPADHRIAETWEVCDRPTESSVLLNGRLRGRTLHQLIEEFEEALLGIDNVARFGLRFPLLIKFLDATRVLGEQVHPNDELTRARGLKDYFGKTEAWYMVKVAPGGTVRCGDRAGLTPDALREALLAGDSRSCMVEYPVAPGDAFLLYAGTMHYSAGGLLFYEIMQNSDVIVGLGRIAQKADEPTTGPRDKRLADAVEAVHIEEGFDARVRPVSLTQGANTRTIVLACEQFALERLDLAEPYPLLMDGRRFSVLSVIAGQCKVVCQKGELANPLLPGQSCLLPAALGEVSLEPIGSASVLKGYVPDLRRDIVAPLAGRGIDPAAIRALGGQTELNPLGRLV